MSIALLKRPKEWYVKSKKFVGEVWIEVKHPGGKVTWPSKPEVKSATIVILLVLFAIGFIYIGGLDWIFASIMDLLYRMIS